MPLYGTVANVVSLFRDIEISASETAIITTECEKFLDDAERLILMRLATHYDTTTIGVESAKVIAQIAEYKAASIVGAILDGDAVVDSGRVETYRDRWGKKAMSILDAIAPAIDSNLKNRPRPTSPLPDTEFATVAPFKASRISGAFKTTRTFSTTSDNW